jgi:hypothetical protein
MKAKLIFDLENPEDYRSYNRANKALELSLALNDVLNIRSTIQKKFENKDIDVFFVLEDLGEEIAKIMEKWNIILDDLIE